MPHTYFCTDFRTILNFIEVFTVIRPDTCSTISHNSTNVVPTPPKGQIGFIKVPITNEKPKNYQVSGINTLFHIVARIYHPDLTEPIPPSNYDLTIPDGISYASRFCLHLNYWTTPTVLVILSSHRLYNVQPTFETSKLRVFPTPPF